MTRILLLGLCLMVAGACGQSQAGVQTSPSPVISGSLVQSPATASASPFTNESHVFIIVMENRSYDQAITGGFTASLARRYGVAANYHAISHPSLPNYLAMTSGSTWGIADDGYHPLPATGLGEQLTHAGIPWRAYMENMPASCFFSVYPYALKHDPFPYYGNRCPPQVVNFSRFPADMKSGNVPRFVWITPNLCNDGHDCSTAVADRWMSQVVPQILATPAWQLHGVLIITWDEGEDSANHVLTLVVRPNMPPSVSYHYYDHYSLLATIEDILGVPRLGAAAHATTMRELVVSASAQP